MYKNEFDSIVKPQVRDVVYREGPDGKKHVYFYHIVIGLES